MQIHEIKPKTKIKSKKRIGRGGKRGTYSGKGVKGQKARAGAKMKPLIRELVKRYPKKRGYKFSPIRKFFVVNLSTLDKVFEDGLEVSPKTLAEKGLISKSKKLPIKILGKGETEKKFHIKGCLISAKAREKVEKAGGKIGQLPVTVDKGHRA